MIINTLLMNDKELWAFLKTREYNFSELKEMLKAELNSKGYSIKVEWETATTEDIDEAIDANRNILYNDENWRIFAISQYLEDVE